MSRASGSGGPGLRNRVRGMMGRRLTREEAYAVAAVGAVVAVAVSFLGSSLLHLVLSAALGTMR